MNFIRYKGKFDLIYICIQFYAAKLWIGLNIVNSMEKNVTNLK